MEMRDRVKIFLILFSINLRYSRGEIISGLENSPLTEVRALVGERVLLPCHMDPPVEKDSTHLVLFYYSHEGTPIYSLDSRGSILDNAQPWADESMMSRAYIETDPGRRGLVLEKVTQQDEGDYRCRVDYLESPTRNFRIKLIVVTPPDKVEITSDVDGKTTLSGTVGPYALGAKVVFTCKATGGSPRPKVTWWDGELLLDNTSEVMSVNFTSNDLEYPRLTRQDFNKSLRCVASNSELTRPVSASINIDMHYPPLRVMVEGGAPRITLKEGVARRLTCEVTGSRPSAKVTWKRTDGRSLPGPLETVVEDILQNGSTRSVLAILPTLEDDGGIIECSGSNPNLTKEALRNITHLSVLYKPQMVLGPDEGSSLENLREGDDVSLKCAVKANPGITEVHWALNGVPLQVTSGQDFEVTRDVLTLRSIDRSSSGNYTCAAANAEGSSTSGPLLLEVKFPPVCASGQQMVFGAARHEEIRVQCTTEAHPVPFSFRWAVNTSTGQVDVALSHSVSSGRQSTVRYTPQTNLDFGDLLCWAENEVDQQETPCVFHVIPAAKPESVTDCTALRNSTMPASSVLVTCAVSSDRGLNQTFTLEVRQKTNEEVLEKFSLATKPHFLVTGLKIGVPYLLTITPANNRGSGPPFTLFYTAPTASADKVIYPHAETAILSLTPLLILILGVLLGVSGCVGFVVVYSRMRKASCRRREEDKMRISYCRSSKDLDADEEDTPSIIRLNQDYDEKEEEARKSAAARSSLYGDPAQFLNNVSSRLPF